MGCLDIFHLRPQLLHPRPGFSPTVPFCQPTRPSVHLSIHHSLSPHQCAQRKTHPQPWGPSTQALGEVPPCCPHGIQSEREPGSGSVKGRIYGAAAAPELWLRRAPAQDQAPQGQGSRVWAQQPAVLISKECSASTLPPWDPEPSLSQGAPRHCSLGKGACM